jgi:hypothetical protein
MAFNLRVFQEVDKVVDVDAKGEGGGGWLNRGVGWVYDDSGEIARVRRIFLEAKTLEYALYFCVPMARTAGEAVKVRSRSQYLFFSVPGSPMGGLTIVASSAGRMPWQKAFLQSTCLSVQQRSTAMLTMKRRVSGQRTGAYLSDFVQMQSSWLPRTTMRDLAGRGLSILSFLMDRTHIVGMVRGVPLARNVLYSARVILS